MNGRLNRRNKVAFSNFSVANFFYCPPLNFKPQVTRNSYHHACFNDLASAGPVHVLIGSRQALENEDNSVWSVCVVIRLSTLRYAST